MIWGMIAPNYKSEVFIYDEYENTKSYIDMLYEKYLNDAITFFGGNFTFQQDGASPHVPPASVDSISNVCYLIINWPANSPDLNVIEMVWSIMVKSLRFIIQQQKKN